MSISAAYGVQQLLNIIQLAAFYAPLAVAFALIQGLTKRVFLSFGDLAMFGSIAAAYVCFGRLLQGDSDLVVALWSLVAAITCAAALSKVAARAVFLPLTRQSPLAFMIAALGFSIALQELMRLTTDSRDIWLPPLFQGQMIELVSGNFPLRLMMNNVVAELAALISLACLFVVLRFTGFGRKWRATVQNTKLAALCGIDTQQVAELTFVLGGGLAAVSGWMAALTYGGTSFSVGVMLGFKAMFAAVAGGFGNLSGAVFGAIALAVLEVSWSVWFGTAYRDAGVFGIIIFVLLLKPEGLSGNVFSRESEA